MRNIVWMVVATLLITGAHAQTRRIAHRSHGGAMHARYDGTDGGYGWNPNVILVTKRDTIGDSVVTRRVWVDTSIHAGDSLRIEREMNDQPVHQINQVGRKCRRMIE